MDKWNNWYKNIKTEDIGSFRYGDTVTYELGYNFLNVIYDSFQVGANSLQ